MMHSAGFPLTVNWWKQAVHVIGVVISGKAVNCFSTPHKVTDTAPDRITLKACFAQLNVCAHTTVEYSRQTTNKGEMR